MTYKRPLCEHCGHRNPVKGFRLDAHNWHPTYTLACPSCLRRLGYQPVSHDRPYANLKANEHMRGAR